MSTELPAGRLAGFAVAVAVMLFLLVRVGAELLGLGAGDTPAAGEPPGASAASPDEPEAAPAVLSRASAPREPAAAAAEERPPVGLWLSVNDRVRVSVEVDGEPWFKGYLCPREGPRCDGGSPLEVPPAPEIALELSDLSHARLLYNGRRVEPLGNLVAGRRLVFIDDAGL